MRTKLAVILSLASAVVLSACHTSPTAPTPSIVNYQGQYTGTYSVTECTETAAGACSGSGFTAGATFPITLSLNQSQSHVTGTMTMGGFRGPFTGDVQPAGNLTGTAAMDPFSNAGLTLTLNVTEWNTTLVNSAFLTGTFSFTANYANTATGSVFATQTVKASIGQLARS